MSFLNPHFQSKKQGGEKKVKIHQTCHQIVVSIMKATGCEGRESISTLKLIMEDPGGETRRGGRL